METKKCVQCKEDIDKEAKECTKCGAKQGLPKVLKLIIIAIVVIIGFIFGWQISNLIFG